jgi:F0F1-type ATP synthase delta subunit
MKNNQNILPFVEAFYQLAKEQKNLNKTILLIKETLQAVLNTNFIDFLADYNLDLENKKKALDKIYKKEQLFIN